MMTIRRGMIAGLSLAAIAVVAVSTVAMAERGEKRAPGKASEMLLQRFDTMDTDKDGKVTVAEIEAFRVARFAAADVNGDGLLDKDELAAFRLEEMQARADAQAARMIERMDGSGDGKLAADEMPGMTGGKPLFDRVDTDGDGAISKAEAEAALAFMMDHRGKGRRDNGDVN
jgi:Ca2+-binding EF-hand superfamily protein